MPLSLRQLIQQQQQGEEEEQDATTSSHPEQLQQEGAGEHTKKGKRKRNEQTSSIDKQNENVWKGTFDSDDEDDSDYNKEHAQKNHNDNTDNVTEAPELKDFYLDDDNDDDDQQINNKKAGLLSNDPFYDRYSETIQVFYPLPNNEIEHQEIVEEKKEQELHAERSQTQQQPISHHSEERKRQETLDVIHQALHPIATRALENNLSSTIGDNNGNVTSNSMIGRYLPRKKRVKINTNATTTITSGTQATSYAFETQEEIENRVKRYIQTEQNAALRQRWKHRKWNFQSEQDIGNVYANRAKTFLESKLRRDKKRKRQQLERLKERKVKEQKAKEEELRQQIEQIDPLEEDDSVKEQNMLLAQLSQNTHVMSQQQGDYDENPIIPDTYASATHNDNDEMLDYWQNGYSLPRAEDINYNYNPSVEEIVQNYSKKEEVPILSDNKKSEESETKVSLKTSMSIRKPGNTFRYYFPLNRTLVTNANSTYLTGYQLGHIQHMLNMSARVLCGSCGGDEKKENRYIRLLCTRSIGLKASKESSNDNATFANYRKERFILTLAEEQGQNMLLYIQNVWNHPELVAKQLGILDCNQESPIQGNLLTSIPRHSKANRCKVKKLYQKSTREWMYDTMDKDLERERHGFEDESSMPQNSALPDVPTSAALDFKTEESHEVNTNNHIIGRLEEGSRDALITPNSLYSHISGTKPPIPPMPLDPVAILFGPVDRYSKYYHGGVKLDSAVCKLILSTLMARIAKKNRFSQSQEVKEIQKQIMALLEDSAEVNENKLHKRYTKYFHSPSDADIPLVEFYRAVSEFCSFVANGCPPSHNTINQDKDDKTVRKNFVSDFDNDIEDNSSVREDENRIRSVQDLGMDEIAEMIWGFCRTKINSNGLLRFPKLRITYGLALICRSIPRSAAEILSRPLDDDDFCTPIDLFMHTLDHMETHKMIYDSQGAVGENSILAAEFEYVLHEAAELFHEAVKIDPINVEYQLWLIGCLSSCLLVSSGNKIASGAHLFPSRKTSGLAFQQGPPHEIRVRLKKYNDVRVELSNSIRVLLMLARHQGSAKAHFAACAVLEWSQMIGLLAGERLEEELLKIRSLHAHHIDQWIETDVSHTSMKYARRVNKSCNVSYYARLLENNPRKIENWRNLVRNVGPLGTSQPPQHEDDPEEHRKTCSKCSRLCQTRWWDHSSTSEKRQEGNWWGSGREWWEFGLLSLSPVDPEKCLLRMAEGVVARLNDEMSGVQSQSELAESSRDNKFPCYYPLSNNRGLDWLPTRNDIEMQYSRYSEISITLRSLCYAKKLPRACHDVLSETESPTTDLVDLALPDISSVSVEVKAYKILLLCHLLGPDHPQLDDHIYCDFIKNCWEDFRVRHMKPDCDEWRVLKWLATMGLNLREVMCDKMQKNPTAHSSRYSKYSQAGVSGRSSPENNKRRRKRSPVESERTNITPKTTRFASSADEQHGFLNSILQRPNYQRPSSSSRATPTGLNTSTDNLPLAGDVHNGFSTRRSRQPQALNPPSDVNSELGRFEYI